MEVLQNPVQSFSMYEDDSDPSDGDMTHANMLGPSFTAEESHEALNSNVARKRWSLSPDCRLANPFVHPSLRLGQRAVSLETRAFLGDVQDIAGSVQVGAQLDGQDVDLRPTIKPKASSKKSSSRTRRWRAALNVSGGVGWTSTFRFSSSSANASKRHASEEKAEFSAGSPPEMVVGPPLSAPERLLQGDCECEEVQAAVVDSSVEPQRPMSPHPLTPRPVSAAEDAPRSHSKSRSRALSAKRLWRGTATGLSLSSWRQRSPNRQRSSNEPTGPTVPAPAAVPVQLAPKMPDEEKSIDLEAPDRAVTASALTDLTACTVDQDPLQDVVSVSLSPVAEASTPFWLHPSSIANCVYLVDPCPDDGADKAPGTFRSAAARARASAASAGLSLSFLPHAANVGAAVKKARRITGKYCMSTQVFGAGLLEKVTDLAEEMTKAPQSLGSSPWRPAATRHKALVEDDHDDDDTESIFEIGSESEEEMSPDTVGV